MQALDQADVLAYQDQPKEEANKHGRAEPNELQARKSQIKKYNACPASWISSVNNKCPYC